MAFDLLSSVSPASKQWKICVRVVRMWEYSGSRDDQPPLHVDFVLVDEKGNAMYAEIPGDEADKFRPIIQESKIYSFSKFLVVPSKPAYKPFPNKYMIRFTPWTKVDEINDVDSAFPLHVFNLVPFSDLSLRVGMQEYFTDVVGMIIGVSKLAYIRMASNSSDTPKRVILLKDLSNCEVKLVLWGQRALDFDADAIHDVGQNHLVVGIFVGTLMKAYNTEETLSGGSACKWYLNEDIPEINEYFDSLTEDAPKIEWISAGVESFGPSRRPARLEQKTVAELKNIDPWETEATTFLCTVTVARLSPSQSWWFLSCSRCHKTATPYGSTYKCSGGCSSVTGIPKYRLCLIGTDGTDSAEFVLFGRVAQQVIGRTVMSLLRSEGRSDNLPREIAAVVSQKFTFCVSVTERSLMQRNISFQVNSIETFFGRQGTIPHMKEHALAIMPAINSPSIATPSKPEESKCSDNDFTPGHFSGSPGGVTEEVHVESSKRRSIIRHPLRASKKLAFEFPAPKENSAAPSPASNSDLLEKEVPVNEQPIASDHPIDHVPSVTRVLQTQEGSSVSVTTKKGSSTGSVADQKSIAQAKN